jgi:hypothetical protein
MRKGQCSLSHKSLERMALLREGKKTLDVICTIIDEISSYKDLDIY